MTLPVTCFLGCTCRVHNTDLKLSLLCLPCHWGEKGLPQRPGGKGERDCHWGCHVRRLHRTCFSALASRLPRVTCCACRRVHVFPRLTWDNVFPRLPRNVFPRLTRDNIFLRLPRDSVFPRPALASCLIALTPDCNVFNSLLSSLRHRFNIRGAGHTTSL